jgi:hypothetical protein
MSTNFNEFWESPSKDMRHCTHMHVIQRILNRQYGVPLEACRNTSLNCYRRWIGRTFDS